MIFGLTYYQICAYFLIYSFLGWCVEVCYHGLTLGVVVNRGFLNGPVCPVYGFGMIVFLCAANSVHPSGLQEMSDLMVFLCGMGLATLVELLAGWILDKAFHARWWDYSHVPLNLHGYICAKFSIIWGLGVLFVVKVIHPVMVRSTSTLIDPKYGWWIMLVLYIGYFVDFIVTVCVLAGMDKRLKELDEVRAKLRIVSDSMSETLGTKSVAVAQKVSEGQVQAELAKAELKENLGQAKEESVLKAKQAKEALLRREAELRSSITKRGSQFRRVTRAFPSMIPHRYAEVFGSLRKEVEETEKR